MYISVCLSSCQSIYQSMCLSLHTYMHIMKKHACIHNYVLTYNQPTNQPFFHEFIHSFVYASFDVFIHFMSFHSISSTIQAFINSLTRSYMLILIYSLISCHFIPFHSFICSISSCKHACMQSVSHLHRYIRPPRNPLLSDNVLK